MPVEQNSQAAGAAPGGAKVLRLQGKLAQNGRCFLPVLKALAFRQEAGKVPGVSRLQSSGAVCVQVVVCQPSQPWPKAQPAYGCRVWVKLLRKPPVGERADLALIDF